MAKSVALKPCKLSRCTPKPKFARGSCLRAGTDRAATRALEVRPLQATNSGSDIPGPQLPPGSGNRAGIFERFLCQPLALLTLWTFLRSSDRVRAFRPHQHCEATRTAARTLITATSVMARVGRRTYSAIAAWTQALTQAL